MKLHRISLPDGAVLQKLVLAQLSDFTGRVELLDQGLSSESGPLCLGIDEERRFVLLISTVADDDAIFVKALGRLSWVVRHQSLLARLYAKREVESSKIPRVILIAPSFSTALREAAVFVGLDMELYQYRALELNNEKALLLDPILVSGRKIIQPTVPIPAVPPDPSSHGQLTDAERDFFEEPPPKSLPI